MSEYKAADITAAGEFKSIKLLLTLSASSSSIETSTPSSAAGTNPKAERALNLPPTLGSALITLYPSDLLDLSNKVPGSVIIII